MNVWDQIDAMKTKFDEDMKAAKNACEAYKFVGLKALDNGQWKARSAKSAKHATSLNAPSADELVAAMKRAFEAAEEAAKNAKRVSA